MFQQGPHTAAFLGVINLGYIGAKAKHIGPGMHQIASVSRVKVQVGTRAAEVWDCESTNSLTCEDGVNAPWPYLEMPRLFLGMYDSSKRKVASSHWVNVNRQTSYSFRVVPHIGTITK